MNITDDVATSKCSLDNESKECERCSICLEEMQEVKVGDNSQHVICLSGCGHRFHTKCIVYALQHNSAFPLCRYRPNNADSESSSASSSPVSSPINRERNVRRAHAIRSSLLRSRHGTATLTAQSAAEEYRMLGQAVRITRLAFRSADREAKMARRSFQNRYADMLRAHLRDTRPLRRRWIYFRSRLDDLEDRHRTAADLLAAEGGFRDHDIPS